MFKDPLFSSRGRILVIHARKCVDWKNYCKEERNFVMANLDLYHNLVECCSNRFVWS